MTTNRVVMHGPWIPEEIARRYKASGRPMVLHLNGLLAMAIRAEAKETNRDELSVVIDYLGQFLLDVRVPKRRPTNCLPVIVEVSGELAVALQKNADAQELTPEDSAIRILCEVFEVQKPPANPKGQVTATPHGPKFDLTIPGAVARAVREANYPTRVDGKFICNILLSRLVEDDTPRIPGF